ncbi:MAG TPA: hypothetical protein VF666_03460 [Pyrinomonadaceae bacterium]|jgi:major membrane immunogen (membrane-anchored lipoprotein)
MNKKVKIGLLMVAFGALASILFWVGTNSSAKIQVQAEQAEHVKSENVFARINDKARAAKGGDEKAVRALADDIVETLTPSEVPVFTKESMKDRVARAELNYRKGKRKGVTEVDAAKTVNQLAADLGAPDFAKTNSRQVRSLRVSMMMGMPNLISPDTPTTKNGRASLPDMSPAEAVSVSLMMLHQKMTNPDYQLGQKEFDDNRDKKHYEKWQAHRAEKTNNGHHNKGPVLWAMDARYPNGKSKNREIKEAVTRGAGAMKVEDLTGLADKTLDKLGIER